MFLFCVVSSSQAQLYFEGQKKDSVTAVGYFVIKSLGKGSKSIFIENKGTDIAFVGFTRSFGRDTVNTYEVLPGDKLELINRKNDSILIKGTGKVKWMVNYGDGKAVDLYGSQVETIDTNTIARLNYDNIFTSIQILRNLLNVYDSIRVYRSDIPGSTNYSSIYRDSIRGQLVIDGVINKIGVGTSAVDLFVGGPADNSAGIKLTMNSSSGGASILNWYSSVLYSFLDIGTNRTGRMRIQPDGSISINSTTDVGQSFYINGDLRVDGTTSTTATAGAQTLPANPVGFLIINISGTNYKLPYYAN